MTRIHGLDLARALALIGMMAAHIGPYHPVTDGFPSVLFAVLAGVSMGIISRNRTDNLLVIRFRLILRGVILVGIGLMLSTVQSEIIVVLMAIGVSYLLLTPVVDWGVRRLAVLLGVFMVLGPLVVAVDFMLVIEWDDYLIPNLLFRSYPLTAWLAYTLVGVLVYRLVVFRDGRTVGRQIWLVGIGLALLVGTKVVDRSSDVFLEFDEEPTWMSAYLQINPHSGGFLDVLGSTGAALAVIGIGLLICRLTAVVWTTYPLRAMGSLSLTVYVAHVLSTTIVNGTFLAHPEPVELDPNWWHLFTAQTIGLLLFSALWRWRFRRGPMEAGVHWMVEGAMKA